MDRIQIARQLRKLMGFSSAGLPDDQAAQVPMLFPAWEETGAYAEGDRVQYGGQLYKCLTGHGAQNDWTPDTAPSLWVRVDDPAEEWPLWRQPVGSTDSYPKGAKVRYENRRWISDLDANVWVPGEYGWSEVV